MSKIQLIVLLFVAFVVCAPQAGAQIRIEERVGKSDPRVNRERGLEMLDGVKETLKKYYYDKNFKGINVDVKFKEARDKIKTLETNADIFRTIAFLLLEFNDSHTRFYPPGRSSHVQYGFSMQAIGDAAYVVDVTKGSDAEKQGMKPGDIVVRIGEFPVTRDSLWAIKYFLYVLEPMTRLPIVVRKANNVETSLVVEASLKTLADRKAEAEKKKKEKRENPYKCAKLSAETIACKLRTFSVDRKFIDQMMTEVAGSKNLILDLRGNGGGFVSIEEYLAGHFFDRAVKVGDFVMRDKKQERIAKPVSKRAFTGELIVLVDSDSASASEVFARLIQIEKRGKVVGDLSSGAVMTSYQIPMAFVRGGEGFEKISVYGMNVTIADLIMSDGGRLENVGVKPDKPIGPTSTALALKTDPVLSYAAQMFGTTVSAEDAGKLNFLHQKSEGDGDDDGDDKESEDN